MKTKTLLLVFTVILGIGCIWFLTSVNGGRKEVAWARLVSFQKQLESFQNLNDGGPFQSFAKNVEKYLKDLGLGGRLSNGRAGQVLNGGNNAGAIGGGFEGTGVGIIVSRNEAASVNPTVVTVAMRGSGPTVYQFIRSSLHHLSWLPVVVYDLGMGGRERKSLLPICNSSKCSIQDFEWSRYPAHIHKLDYGAYRPIIIQEMLNTTGAVLYMTPEHRIISSSGLSAALERAQTHGLAGWSLSDDSTSAVTHPKMFTYYNTVPHNYYFHRTVSGDPLLVYNLPTIPRSLMLPWLSCALTEPCLAPLGVDPSGCRRGPSYRRRPLYLYSGCHWFDTSALNVVLGLLFHYEATTYTMLIPTPDSPSAAGSSSDASLSFFLTKDYQQGVD